MPRHARSDGRKKQLRSFGIIYPVVQACGAGILGLLHTGVTAFQVRYSGSPNLLLPDGRQNTLFVQQESPFGAGDLLCRLDFGSQVSREVIPVYQGIPWLVYQEHRVMMLKQNTVCGVV